MNPAVLVLNSGSSSVKFALFRGADADSRRLISGGIDNIERAPRLSLREADGEASERALDTYPDRERTRAEALALLIDVLLLPGLR